MLPNRLSMAKFNKKRTIRLRRGLGWAKDLADEHDWTWKKVRNKFGFKPKSRPAPSIINLRKFFPPVRDQGGQNSSTAFACLALVEYFQHRTLGTICERSKAFLHAMTRASQDRNTAAIGLGIRDTLKMLVRCGAPPEVYWPYSATHCKSVPNDDPLLFSFVGDYRGLYYARLDLPDGPGSKTLNKTKKCLVAGIPVVFGFEVHHEAHLSLPPSAMLPVAKPYYAVGWQSVVACGYDESKQCLLIRNSWGKTWGKKGYAWLPYEYVIKNHTADFWILVKEEWLEQLAEQIEVK
jgi:C1A family cysteine protease